MASQSGRRYATTAAPWVSLLKTALKKNGGSPGARFCQLATIGLDGGPRVRTIVYRGTYEGQERKPEKGEAQQAGEAGANDGTAAGTASAPALMFVTDARANKVAEARADARAEVAWYLTHTREQFRFRGRLVLVTAETGKGGSGHTAHATEKEQDDAGDAAPACFAGERGDKGDGWTPPQLQALRARVWSEMSDKTRAQMHWPHPGEPRDPSQPSSLWQAPPQDVDVSASSAVPNSFVLVLLRAEHVDNLHLRTNRRFTHDLVAKGDDDAQGKPARQRWVQQEVNP